MSVLTHIQRFLADRSGAIAPIFAIVVIPVLGLASAAIDYSRAATERSRLQAAVDATALSVIHLPQGTPANVVQSTAQSFFQSIYTPPYGVPMPQVTTSYANSTLNVSASETLPTGIASIIGVSSVTIGARSTTLNQQSSVEIALALDNTGSMAQNGKIESLKTAVNNLLTNLQRYSRTPGDVKVSLVPFNTQVNIGTANPNANYLRYDVGVTNTSLRTYLQSVGISRNAPTPANWNGCLSDRDQSYFNYDTRSDGVSGVTNTRYVASFCHYYTTGSPSPGAQIVPTRTLTTDLEAIRTGVNSMQPTGATNITMGLVMGMATLRSDNPFGTNSSSDPFTKKFLVLLTDGANTQNRFVGNGSASNSAVDDRMTLACNDAKARSVRVFTIGVLDGQSALLRDCASDSSSYFPVTDASQLNAVFQQILGQVTGIRVGS
ncbi:MAG: VWA domain-containing protein [Hyphomicrobiales bacterium]|nr:VWA domain-containing protein [Hyphomicrobiales bacterium]